MTIHEIDDKIEDADLENLFSEALEDKPSSVEDTEEVEDTTVIEEEGDVVPDDTTVETHIDNDAPDIVVESGTTENLNNDVTEELTKLKNDMKSVGGKMSKLERDVNEKSNRIAELELELSNKATVGVEGDTKPQQQGSFAAEFETLMGTGGEYPDFVNPIRHLISQYSVSKEYVESLVDKLVAAKLATIEKSFNSFKEETETKSLQDQLEVAHPDYKSLIDDLDYWINLQSPSKSKVYKEICATGSVVELIDLFTIYKEANGLIKKPQSKEVTKEKEKRLTSMVGVRSTSATPKTTVVDKYDMESAAKDAGF